jgi:hypothetical protein
VGAVLVYFVTAYRGAAVRKDGSREVAQGHASF